MPRYILKTATVGVAREGSEELAITIPAGSLIVSGQPIEEIAEEADQSQMVEVHWNGEIVSVFLLDLKARSERVGLADKGR
jgi:hypothetical protein